jgi:4-hydroxy-tetrahydrodipicolinate synthase
MKRRKFIEAVGLSVVGVGAATITGPSRASASNRLNMDPRAISLSDRKEWARQHFRGMENFVFPSFTSDHKDLDEEGIRHDVRHAARQGFVSTMPLSLGLDADERRRMLETVTDEARGKVLVTASIGGGTPESRAERVKHAERIGVSQMFYTLPSSASSEEQLYNTARAAITATDLNVVLYGRPTEDFRRFDQSGLPLDVLDRLADLPNVIAIKLTQVISPVTAFQLAGRIGDRVLLGPVNLDLVPLLSSHYPIQWSGQWAVDALQSPEMPHAARFMNLVGQGKMDDAVQVYWEMQPALQAFFDLQAPLLRSGGHPWTHLKYYHWATGGNGGLFRESQQNDHVPALDAEGRRIIRETFRKVGITPVDLPDEAFMVGNAAYARGARAGELAATSQYAL